MRSRYRLICAFLIAVMAIPSAVSAQNDRLAEASCGVTVMFGDRHLSLDDALRQCRARYGWNDAQTSHARRIVEFSGGMLGAGANLRRGGFDPSNIDAIYFGLTDGEKNLIGSPDATQRPEGRAALERVRSQIRVINSDRAFVSNASRYLVFRAAIDLEFRAFLSAN